jgi:hypothetical protein
MAEDLDADVVSSFRVGHSEDGSFIVLMFNTAAGVTISLALPHALAPGLIGDIEEETDEATTRRQAH